jgi:glutamate racemase
VIGTKATIDSNRYEILLSKLGYKNITSRATSLFVPIVEEGLFSGRILDEVMEHYFADIEKPKAIILGCTHFPLIADAIYNYWNKDAILIHSGDAIVDYLKERYTFKPLKRATKIKYFASENPKGLKAIADRWLKM